jgi:hypothetical protein
LALELPSPGTVDRGEGQLVEVSPQVLGRDSGEDLGWHLGLATTMLAGRALIDPFQKVRILPQVLIAFTSGFSHVLR